jgi:hypothetical protein
MTDPNDPAFPYLDGDLQLEGLTICEYMATQILAGICASKPTSAYGESNQEMEARLIRCSVRMAHGLLVALNAVRDVPGHRVREDDGEPE